MPVASIIKKNAAQVSVLPPRDLPYPPLMLVEPTTAGLAVDRDSAAYQFDSNGIFQALGSDAVASGHYIGGIRHLLLQSGGEGLFDHSVDAASWNSLSPEITLTAATSCIAGQTAHKLADDGTDGSARLRDSLGHSGAKWSGNEDTVPWIVETGDSSEITLEVSDLDGSLAYRLDIDTSDNSVTVGGTGSYDLYVLDDDGPNSGKLYLVVMKVTGSLDGRIRLDFYPTGKAVTEAAFAYFHYCQVFNSEDAPITPVVTSSNDVTQETDDLTLTQSWESQECTRYIRYYDFSTASTVDAIDVDTRTGPDDFSQPVLLDRAYTHIAYFFGDRTIEWCRTQLSI